MSGIKFTGIQLQKYLKLMREIDFLSEEESDVHILETYNSTADDDIRHIIKAYWQTKQAVEEINQKAKIVLEKKKLEKKRQ